MKPGSDKILARALRAVERAEEHSRDGDPERAAERAYYAVVHTARALLNEVGERPRSHTEVRGTLEGLASPAPQSLREALARSLEWRSAGETLHPADAERLVGLARPAFDEVRGRIESDES